jgi:hypothetical protein
MKFSTVHWTIGLFLRISFFAHLIAHSLLEFSYPLVKHYRILVSLATLYVSLHRVWR